MHDQRELTRRQFMAYETCHLNIMKKLIFTLCFCLLPFLSTGQELFTVKDVQIMHETGVRVQLPGERTAHVLPAKTSPGDLLQVEMLDFSDSSLYRIPHWLKRFTNLRRLDLSKNYLDADKDLLETLQAMPKLDVLNLSDNPLFAKEPASEKSLAPVWQVLSELEKLYLSGTEGTAKNYGSLAPLTSLKVLDISHNRIKNEISVLQLDKLSDLQELNLSHNGIGRFFEKELPVRSLELLDLSHNGLTEIPYVEMNQLKIWNLQGNGAVRLADDYDDPFSLKNIKKLQYDNGSDYNNLTQLPKGLKKRLRKQRELSCSKGIRIDQYIDHCDGTIIDTETGLMWKRCPEGLSGMNCEEGKAGTYTWNDFVQRFKNVEYAGHADWRLPTIDELSTLVYCNNGRKDKNHGFLCNISKKPTINEQAFPNTPHDAYWSGSPSADRTGSAWNIRFFMGYLSAYSKISLCVLLVRGGQ